MGQRMSFCKNALIFSDKKGERQGHFKALGPEKTGTSDSFSPLQSPVAWQVALKPAPNRGVSRATFDLLFLDQVFMSFVVSLKIVNSYWE